MQTLQYPSELKLWIDGQWVSSAGRDVRPVVNPATGQVVGQLPVATLADIDLAVQSAQDAFSSWSLLSAWERGDVLMRAAKLVQDRKQTLAPILTVENGKPLGDSLGELDRVVDTLVFCAEEGKRTFGRIMPSRAKGLSQQTIKQAVGPIGAFVPWNFPAVLAIRKLAAALAAGCTVVMKPAEECPAICIELVKVMLEAGLPPTAVQLLFGVPGEISERVIAAPAIRKVSFTGSVAVGRLLAEQAGRLLKPCTMELGGHAPVIIFDDVNVENVAKMCAGFKFRNAGQVCLSPSRFYIQSSIYADFVRAFAEIAKQIKVGQGFEKGVQMGPLNNPRRLEAAERLTQDALDRGAKAQAGGMRLDGDGYFFAPTVLTDVDSGSAVLHEEPFCPIAPVMQFETIDQAIKIANQSTMGLAAYAFTNRLDRAYEFAQSIEAGWVGVNNFTPALADAAVGGMKDSGLGYEGGPEGLDAYLHSKFVSQSNLPV